jgi:hypothetical protein
MTNTPNTSSVASKLQSQNVSMTDIEEGRAQTLSNIAELQNIEKNYFSELNEKVAQNNLTEEEKQSLIDRINEISLMRTNLYKNLNGMYSFYTTNVSSTRNTIEEQNAAIEIVENELNEAKIRMLSVEEDKNNKLRLVEINSYYGEQYSDHAQIMKIIVMICVPVLILTILSNNGLIPRGIYSVLVIVIVSFGLIYIWKYLLNASSHDNMNYEEYTWNFKPQDAPEVDTSAADAVDPWDNTTNVTCQGQACCDSGYTYDSTPSVNKCVPSDSLTPSTTTNNASSVTNT